jgi:hypothetical protein
MLIYLQVAQIDIHPKNYKELTENGQMGRDYFLCDCLFQVQWKDEAGGSADSIGL